MKSLLERPKPARDGQLRCAANGRRAQDRNWFYVQRCVLPVHEGAHRFEWEQEEVL